MPAQSGGPDIEKFGYYVLEFSLGALIIGLVILIFVSVIGAIRSNGETDYCIIKYLSPQGMPPIYELNGHRPWMPDREIAKFQTIDEAVKAAATMQCPLQRKP